MPVYVYKCNDCDYLFEARQHMTDEPLTNCPQCDGELRRVINSVGIVFKGSGFYVTDTRNGKNGHVGGKGGDSTRAKSDEKGKETKADKKSEES
jgi:putative FmdB family regulatory protein